MGPNMEAVPSEASTGAAAATGAADRELRAARGAARARAVPPTMMALGLEPRQLLLQCSSLPYRNKQAVSGGYLGRVRRV